MLLLGHIVWAYLVGKSCSSLLKVKINPLLVMFLGALPDVDLALSRFGIEHRAITHNLFFWAVIFAPILIKYRKRAIPYFLAPMSHALIGDLIVDSTNPTWPFTSARIGLDFSLFSSTSIAIEIIGLFILLLWSRQNGDMHLMLQKLRGNLLSIVILLPVVAFILLNTNNIIKAETLTAFANTLPIAMIGHIILAALLLVSFLQGLRALRVSIRPLP